ncbi:MAG: cytochrome c3 family protein [Candidatus Promineifilaceae bacterium]
MAEEVAKTKQRSILRLLWRSKLPLAALALMLLCAGSYLVFRVTRAEPAQPIDYSHTVHVESGIECLYCHSEAMRSQIAGIPSVEKCMGCHSYIVTDSDLVQALTDIWEGGETIAWQRVNDQPDFVYFSHQPHMLAGMNCETCHGNVGAMDQAEETVRMDMGWCLDCHKNQAPDRIGHLFDCLICHK